MKISVVIPALNEEDYIRDTLKSIQSQVEKPHEIIVVDGGSKDKTVKIATDLGAKVIKELRPGIGLARQVGLENVTGEVAAYTDADTIVPPTWIRDIKKYFRKNQSCIGVYGYFKVKDGWWLYRMYINHFQPAIIHFGYLVGINMPPGQNLSFRKDSGMKSGGFPKDFMLMEDFEIMKRLKKHGEVKFIKSLVVISSGRRGREGFKFFTRSFSCWLGYILRIKKSISKGFPHFR